MEQIQLILANIYLAIEMVIAIIANNENFILDKHLRKDSLPFINSLPFCILYGLYVAYHSGETLCQKQWSLQKDGVPWTFLHLFGILLLLHQ